MCHVSSEFSLLIVHQHSAMSTRKVIESSAIYILLVSVLYENIILFLWELILFKPLIREAIKKAIIIYSEKFSIKKLNCLFKTSNTTIHSYHSQYIFFIIYYLRRMLPCLYYDTDTHLIYIRITTVMVGFNKTHLN